MDEHFFGNSHHFMLSFTSLYCKGHYCSHLTLRNHFIIALAADAVAIYLLLMNIQVHPF